MAPIPLILLLLSVGIVLLIGELLLPTHGVLGIAGALCIAGVIIICFRVNQSLGVSVLVGAIIASPFVLNLGMKAWAASPIGKRVILQPVDVAPAPPAVKIGQIGKTVSELRPMGECDFGQVRLEAVAELGIIPSGQAVKVVSVENGRPTVREIESSAAA